MHKITIFAILVRKLEEYLKLGFKSNHFERIKLLQEVLRIIFAFLKIIDSRKK